MKDKQIIECVPLKLREKENVPLISYKLGPTITNKLFNYKETVKNGKQDNDKTDCSCLNI